MFVLNNNKNKNFIIVLVIIVMLVLTACNDDANVKKTGNVDNRPLECKWILSIDDTITVNVDGIDIKHHLIMNAQKIGGIYDLGVYEGTAELISEVDFSSFSSEVFKVEGGVEATLHDDNVTLTIAEFDGDEYANGTKGEGDTVALALLTNHDGMAIGTFNMVGDGNFGFDLKGLQGEKGNAENQFGSSQSIKYYMLVTGGQVSVQVPYTKSSKSFNGMIIGEPLN